MRLKFVPALFVAVLFAVVLIQACRKTDSPSTSVSKQFTTKAAKEWWYGSFRKSAEYSQIDRSSPLATPVGSSAKKYPGWKRATSYSVGSLQIVELPLVYETNSILLPGMQKLYNTPEGFRIAKSAIHRLMLIKKADGIIAVRTVTIVPSAEYAKLYNYDISHISLNGLPSDFSGYQMISGWDKSEKNILRISAGKPVKKIKIITAETLARQKSSSNISAREVCQDVWVPNMVWVCAILPSGDDFADQERCQEQGTWAEQGGYYQLQCHEEPDEDPCVGMSQEECMCQLYGIGCGGGDDDPPPPDPCEDAQPGADKATNFSQNSNFTNTKSAVQNAGASDNKEHGITFGKDVNGNITTSSMTTGGTSSGTVPNWPGAFADMHNHPSNTPPSSGDLYGFIDLAKGSSLYEIRYVVTASGVVYALIVTNLQAAIHFDSLHQRVPTPGYEPDFPDPLYQDFQDAKLYLKGIMSYSNLMAEEMAMAFVLDKYNSGIALLKQDSNGNFKRLGTVESTQPDGSKTYASNNCQ